MIRTGQKIFLFACLAIAQPMLSLASPSHAPTYSDEESSLGLQMARRMILLQQTRPIPSRGLQWSSEMVKRLQEAQNQPQPISSPNKRAKKAANRLPKSS